MFTHQFLRSHVHIGSRVMNFDREVGRITIECAALKLCKPHRLYMFTTSNSEPGQSWSPLSEH